MLTVYFESIKTTCEKSERGKERRAAFNFLTLNGLIIISCAHKEWVHVAVKEFSLSTSKRYVFSYNVQECHMEFFIIHPLNILTQLDLSSFTPQSIHNVNSIIIISFNRAESRLLQSDSHHLLNLHSSHCPCCRFSLKHEKRAFSVVRWMFTSCASNIPAARDVVCLTWGGDEESSRDGWMNAENSYDSSHTRSQRSFSWWSFLKIFSRTEHDCCNHRLTNGVWCERFLGLLKMKMIWGRLVCYYANKFHISWLCTRS